MSSCRRASSNVTSPSASSRRALKGGTARPPSGDQVRPKKCFQKTNGFRSRGEFWLCKHDVLSFWGSKTDPTGDSAEAVQDDRANDPSKADRRPLCDDFFGPQNCRKKRYGRARGRLLPVFFKGKRNISCLAGTRGSTSVKSATLPHGIAVFDPRSFGEKREHNSSKTAR